MTNQTNLELSRESVVLITGGARGITAAIGSEMARQHRCKLVLVGRSPLPSAEESAETAALTDAREIKAVLMRQFHRTGQQPAPSAIESAYRKLMREREIRSNMRAMKDAASEVEYHSIDVTDAPALGRVIDSLYERYGKIDVVIHGAGVIEDKFIQDKSPDSFERVIRPKISGALTLARSLRPESVKLLVFFSSVSARYGNRGQGDYAAANEVLNKLAVWLNARWPGRVVSVNWGPWKTEGGDGVGRVG